MKTKGIGVSPAYADHRMIVQAENRVPDVESWTMPRRVSESSILPVGDFGAVDGKCVAQHQAARTFVIRAVITAEHESAGGNVDERIAGDRTLIGGGRPATKNVSTIATAVIRRSEVDTTLRLAIEQKHLVGRDLDSDRLIDLAGEILVCP